MKPLSLSKLSRLMNSSRQSIEEKPAKKRKAKRPKNYLPSIVKELAKADKGIKSFLLNCHPYVVAGAPFRSI